MARHRLLVRYGYTPELGKLCHELLEQVVRDRPDLPVAQLFDRFVGWALPPQRWQGREEPQQPPQRGGWERGGRR